MTEVLEEVAQDFECLDSDALALRGQELADHPVAWKTKTDQMSMNDFSKHFQSRRYSGSVVKTCCLNIIYK